MNKNWPQDIQKQGKTGFDVYKKGRKYDNILGINVDSTSASSVLRHVSSLIGVGRKFLVVTPNPEIVMQAQDDAFLSGILNSADISLPDGIGLVWASQIQAHQTLFSKTLGVLFSGNRSQVPTPRLHSSRQKSLPENQSESVSFATHFSKRFDSPLVKRVSGIDMMEKLMELASEREWRVFLLGGKPGVAEEAAKKLLAYWPTGLIAYDSGPWLDESGKPANAAEKKKEQKVLKKINDFRPHLLFVGFGAPKQEKWVSRNLKLLDINCAMVVGGALDYISGRVPRAPGWMQRAGLEWLFRLIVEPWRAGRQLSLLKFVWLVLTK